MSLDLRAIVKFPTTEILTINNSTVIEIKFPIGAKKVSLSSEDGDIYVYLIDGLADGGTPSGTDGYQFCAQNNILSYAMTSGTTRRSEGYVKFKTTVSGKLNIFVEGW